MKKAQLIIVGINVPESIILKAKTEYPDHEITVVDDLNKWKKENSEPIPFTRPKFEDPTIPYIPSIKELKQNNPWPTPHSSSRHSKKY